MPRAAGPGGLIAMPVAADIRANPPIARRAPETRMHAPAGAGNYETDTVRDREWDDIVAGFEDVSFEQTAAYSRARWGAQKTSHLLVREGGAVVSGARVVEITIPGLRKGLAYVKFGPLWRRRNRSADPKAYVCALEALAGEYCERRGLLLSILPRPNPEFGALEQTMLEANGFVNRRPYADPERYLVDLSLDEEAQAASLGQRWRRNLKKSAASNLDIGLAAGADAHRRFRALHAHMVGRKNAAHGDAIDHLPGLRKDLPEALAPKIVIASRGGEPVAGAVVALHGDTAYYVYGATSEKALPLRAGFALQWWIVRWASDLGLRWYDLGGNAGDGGLKQFKTGLAGRRGAIVQMPGEYDRWSRGGDRLAADALFAARALSRQAARLRALRFRR
ncbi:MAG TPA: GNAT family N-acetyltransferase [Rhizobiales bacterium]|nr:GNAT family N-acetyltransferase [Hyphomicrobiales bacterium]